MKQYPKFLRMVVAVLVLTIVGPGCMTEKLWTERTYHPAKKPQIQLLAASDRPLILVGYREQFENSRYIRSRAYWLDLDDHYNSGGQPVFVDPAQYPGLLPVPLLAPTQSLGEIPAVGYFAREILNEPGFELWKDGQARGQFLLPVYEANAPVTPEQIAATPLAVLVDAGIVILVAAGVAAYLYLESETN